MSGKQRTAAAAQLLDLNGGTMGSGAVKSCVVVVLLFFDLNEEEDSNGRQRGA